MALMLPSTVEELNLLQNVMELPSPTFAKPVNKGFENIIVEKRYKREVSIPNALENWNILNFETYLNFEDNIAEEVKVIGSLEDRLVPEGDQRLRCESFSSVSSTPEEKRAMFPNQSVKTFSTICMDSGSTCISSDHSYVSASPSLFRSLEAEETYQNLDAFLQQVPEINLNSSMPSPFSGNDSNFEFSTMNSFAAPSPFSQDSYMDSSMALSETTSEDCVFTSKIPRLSDSPLSDVHYTEVRRKNNVSSKTCRKTRREKQKEMDMRLTELEKDRADLLQQVKTLEEEVYSYKTRLLAIVRRS